MPAGAGPSTIAKTLQRRLAADPRSVMRHAALQGRAERPDMIGHRERIVFLAGLGCLWFLGGAGEIFVGGNKFSACLLSLGGAHFAWRSFRWSQVEPMEKEPRPREQLSTDEFVVPAFLLVLVGIFVVYVSWPSSPAIAAIGLTAVSMGVRYAREVFRKYGSPHNQPMQSDDS